MELIPKDHLSFQHFSVEKLELKIGDHLITNKKGCLDIQKKYI